MEAGTLSIDRIVPGATSLDVVAIVVFCASWVGFTFFADRASHRCRTLGIAMRRHRALWFREMLHRENRMVDAQILAITIRNVSLFLSISVLIVGSAIAALGSLEKAQLLATDLAFVTSASRAMMEVKVLSLGLVFVYAFFKFAWALRQFNYAATLLGAAPASPGAETAEWYVESLARMASFGAQHYNRGVRAYYFGLAMLAWFLHPLLMVVAAIWVVQVLHRREFRSRTFRILAGLWPDGPDGPGGPERLYDPGGTEPPRRPDF